MQECDGLIRSCGPAKMTLEMKRSFLPNQAVREWQSFNIDVSSYYKKLPVARDLWTSIMVDRRKEFPNPCK